jgi:peptidoglycan/LPS O-acetylase OafA/YrhL
VTLDGLRGVAAVCIVVLHCYRYFGDMMWSSAALAVDLFFVLSGFVLSSAYDGRFAGGMSWRGFIKARCVRLYPLYLLGFLLGTSAEILSIHYHRGAIELSPAQFWTTAKPFPKGRSCRCNRRLLSRSAHDKKGRCRRRRVSSFHRPLRA